MNKPIELSEFVTYWQLSSFSMGKIMYVPNTESSSTGLFNTKTSAEQAMLMLTLQQVTPQKYFIHEVSYPLTALLKKDEE